MIVCNRCMGVGKVVGDWSIEECAECAGTGKFKRSPRRTGEIVSAVVRVAYCIIMVILLGAVLRAWLEVFQ